LFLIFNNFISDFLKTENYNLQVRKNYLRKSRLEFIFSEDNQIINFLFEYQKNGGYTPRNNSIYSYDYWELKAIEEMEGKCID
jgi:hypothetical protein